MATLEELREFFQDDRYAAFSGAQIDEAENGKAVCSMLIKPMHMNAGGVVQGGAIFTLADFAFAVASNAKGTLTVSLNNSISFLEAAKGSRLIARAVPVSDGNRIVVYQVSVWDDLGTHVAEMTVNGYVKKGAALPFAKK